MFGTDQSITRLHAFRLSHCATCGCARCRRIDQLLDKMEEPTATHSEADDEWMIEGRLQSDEHGQLTLTQGNTVATVNDILSNWQGHRILILIGARETQS
jgi:hypothetical protein